MAKLIAVLVVLLLIAALVLVVLWFQRCPRCKSLWGPKGLRGWLLPDNGYKVQRYCRRCGHAWIEETKIEPETP